MAKKQLAEIPMNGDQLAERTARAKALVRNHSIVNGAIGAVPIPPLGVALNLANGLKMVHGLSAIYDVEYEKELVKTLVSSFFVGCGTFSISGRLVWGLSTLVPVAGPVISVVTRPVLGAGLMYAMGQIFLQHFESGGTFLTFDPQKVRDHYAELLAEGKVAATEK